MFSDATAAPINKKIVIAGWVISALPALMLIASGIMKIAQPEAVIKEFDRLGWPVGVAASLGVVELIFAVIYLIPQSAVLGAILMTGYLGGAIATHVRIGDPFIAPAIVGVVVWLGLYLRSRRIQALFPLSG